MAEMTTDAQALSAASTEFDGIRSFFLFEDSASESGGGMQDTEKGVTGMFASTPVDRSGTQYQSAADDAASSLGTSMGFTPPDDGFDFKAVEAGEAASDSLKYNFGGIEGAADGAKGGNVEFEWKIEEGESSADVFDLATETDGGGGGIPATMAEWALLLV